MKKWFLAAVCLTALAGCSKNIEDIPSPRAESAAATKAAAQQVHVNISFTTFSTGVAFYVSDWERYQITRVTMRVHNVSVYGGTGTSEPYPGWGHDGFLQVPSVQIIAEGAWSETIPMRLEPLSYVDQNSIEIRTDGNYTFAWTITGVSVGSGTGGGGNPDPDPDPYPGDSVARRVPPGVY